jgi:hypothetical protein
MCRVTVDISQTSPDFFKQESVAQKPFAKNFPIPVSTYFAPSLHAAIGAGFVFNCGSRCGVLF